MSNDGRFLAFCSNRNDKNKYVKIKDLKTNNIVLKIEKISSLITFSPDSRYIAVGFDQWISVINLLSGDTIATINHRHV